MKVEKGKEKRKRKQKPLGAETECSRTTVSATESQHPWLLSCSVAATSYSHRWLKNDSVEIGISQTPLTLDLTYKVVQEKSYKRVKSWKRLTDLPLPEKILINITGNSSILINFQKNIKCLSLLVNYQKKKDN